MLLRAARELALDLAASVMVGDRLTDMQAGRAAGVGHCVLVRSGHAPGAGDDERAADAVYDNLAAFTERLVVGHSAHAASPPRDGPPIDAAGRR